MPLSRVFEGDGNEMSEKSEIVQKTVGFGWSFSVKRTTRTPKEGSKYDDVTETEAALSGHADTLQSAIEELSNAKSQVRQAVAD